ncbi:fibrillarin-like rRNA/tRNA 2'-O-methyltransferase [Candidatus Woesearchaeota archaeon]|nr:fibrillarin-like rRNA/tRNA 2'-O-methyltransferase [Candidatus Woesearchaeota archaeon]
MITSSQYQGVFVEKKGVKSSFYTKNLLPGRKVYDERLVRLNGAEYREWNPKKSKIGAALAKNIVKCPIKEGDCVLYLGCASGTTASHISDIIGVYGFLFGIDFAYRVMRDFLFLCDERKNMVPILADCGHPELYEKRIFLCDVIIQDIAQKNQLQIFLQNLRFLKKGGFGFLVIKARSIDVVKNPKKIFEEIRVELQKHVKIIDYRTLDPFEIDHCIFLIEKEKM